MNAIKSVSPFAVVFPGQGSQSVGMMSALAAEHGEVAERFATASGVLGFDLWDLVSNGPVDSLNRTENTQPAMLAAGVASWDVWLKSGGPMPARVAGHSFGEYTALVCAGALEFGTAVALAADRGRYMQEAVPEDEGAMAAILGLELDILEAICEWAAGDTGTGFTHSLFVLTSVLSTPRPDTAVVDAGLKALAFDSGPPQAWRRPGVTYRTASDEHGTLDLIDNATIDLGDKLLLVPGHCDPTVNLHDWYVGLRDGRVERLWPVAARGAAT